MTPGRRSIVAALALAVSLPVSPVAACGFHGTMVDIAAAHPRSIGVAFAVRDAFDRGELSELPSLPPALGFLRARRLLLEFAEQVAAVTGARSGSVAVLLVESGLWTRYMLTASGASATPHVDGPLPRESVLLTSEAALAAIVDGSLTAGHAARLGLLAVP